MLRVVLVSLALAVSGCSSSPTVSELLQQETENGAEDRPFRLTDLTDFEWDGFVAFGPYTTQEVAERALGFPWPEISQFEIDRRDSLSVLVFVKDGLVVRAERHPRCKPDFDRRLSARLFAPGETVLVIDRSVYCATARPAV